MACTRVRGREREKKMLCGVKIIVSHRKFLPAVHLLRFKVTSKITLERRKTTSEEK